MTPFTAVLFSALAVLRVTCESAQQSYLSNYNTSQCACCAPTALREPSLQSLKAATSDRQVFQLLDRVLVCITIVWPGNAIKFLQNVLLELPQFSAVARVVEIILIVNNDQLDGFRKWLAQRGFLYENLVIHSVDMSTLKHPHFLTHVHKKLFLEALRRPDPEHVPTTFVYLEEDMVLTAASLLSWAIDTTRLASNNVQRGFHRVETGRCDCKWLVEEWHTLALTNLFKVSLDTTTSGVGQTVDGAHQYFVRLVHPYSGMMVSSHAQIERFAASPLWKKETYEQYGTQEFAACGIHYMEPVVVPYDPVHLELFPLSAVWHSSNRHLEKSKLCTTSIFKNRNTATQQQHLQQRARPSVPLITDLRAVSSLSRSPSVQASDVGVAVWLYKGDMHLALCQQQLFLSAFPNRILLGDDADKKNSIEQLFGALPPSQRSYESAQRKQLLAFVELYRRFPNLSYYVVLDPDVVVFVDALLAALKKIEQRGFLGGAISDNLIYGGLMVVTRDAVQRIAENGVWLSCIFSIEDTYRTKKPIWTGWRAWIGGDHYVNYCFTRFEYGPRVPQVRIAGVHFEGCGDYARSGVRVVSCHHIGSCPKMTQTHQTVAKFNNQFA